MIMASRDASRPLEVRRGRRQRRRGDERLHLGHEGPAALERHRDAGAGHREVAPRQEETARVGQADDADVGQVEAADLVGGAEAVLDRADEAQPGVPVALELHDDVDEVLEHPGARDGAVLGDVADEQHGHAPLLGGPDQAGRDLADLGDVAGLALDLGAGHGLHRVDDEQVGRPRLDVAEHRREVGLGREVEGVGDGVDALGATAHLGGRLLTADIEHGGTRTGLHAPPRRAAASTCRPPAPPRRARPTRARAPRRAPGRTLRRRWACAAARVTSTSPMRGAGVTAVAAVVRAGASPTSATLPHAWHSPQRPTHLSAVHPHSEQRKPAARREVVLVAMADNLRARRRHRGPPR